MPLPPVGPPLREPGLPDDLFCDRDEPTEADLLGLCPDLLAGPPDGEDAWLGDLSRATDGIRLLSGVRSFSSQPG